MPTQELKVGLRYLCIAGKRGGFFKRDQTVEVMRIYHRGQSITVRLALVDENGQTIGPWQWMRGGEFRQRFSLLKVDGASHDESGDENLLSVGAFVQGQRVDVFTGGTEKSSAKPAAVTPAAKSSEEMSAVVLDPLAAEANKAALTAVVAKNPQLVFGQPLDSSAKPLRRKRSSRPKSTQEVLF